MAQNAPMPARTDDLAGCRHLMDELDIWIPLDEVASEYQFMVPRCATSEQIEEAFSQAVKTVLTRLVNLSQSF